MLHSVPKAEVVGAAHGGRSGRSGGRGGSGHAEEGVGLRGNTGEEQTS